MTVIILGPGIHEVRIPCTHIGPGSHYGRWPDTHFQAGFPLGEMASQTTHRHSDHALLWPWDLGGGDDAAWELEGAYLRLKAYNAHLRRYASGGPTGLVTSGGR